MGRKLFITIVICLSITYSSLGYPSRSDSDSDEDSQQQQQQNINSDSFEEFTQKLQSIKGRQKPEKVQVVEEDEPYDPCLDIVKRGPCKAYTPRYFFDKDSGSCETFQWGGCRKNGNNFREFSDCESTCEKHISKARLDEEPVTIDHVSVVEICEKPPVQGIVQCQAYIPRWTYNATQEQCTQFVWGGCGKTENNYASETLCKKTCDDYTIVKGYRGGSVSTTAKPKPQPPKPVGREVCELPSDEGVCYAHFQKYYFNKLNNRCELFAYGGCGGNGNRFDTPEDCLRACGGDQPTKGPDCMDVKCPWHLYDQYESLGCSPIYDGDACCPTRYECYAQQQEPRNNTLDSRSLTLEERDEEEARTPDPEVTMSPKCRYRGKMYNVGEMVEEASDTGSCRAGCICTDSNGGSGPRIICAQIECPEQLQGRPRGKENCIPLYKRGACCAHDYHCPEGKLTIIDPSRRQQPDGNNPPLAKCNVDGNSVYEGQRVYPDKSPCAKCLCEKNPANAQGTRCGGGGIRPSGNLSPLSEHPCLSTSLEGQLHCEKVDCGIEIYYSHYLAQGCSPVYYEREDGTPSCCPIKWECPDDKQQESDNEDNANTTPETPEPGMPHPPKPPSTDFPVLMPSPPTPPDTDKSKSPLIRSREACSMEKMEGDCKGHRPSFYFNGETGKCESFMYTGCKGNLNNFASHEDCKNLCESTSAPLPPSPPAKGGKTRGGLLTRSGHIDDSPAPSRQDGSRAISLTEVDPCTLPKRVGRCKGYFPRFYYSPEENECKLFIFGGCRPNGNNFYSKDSCEATCLNNIPVENLRTNVPASFAIERRMVSESCGDSSRVNFGDEKSVPMLRTRSSTKSDSGSSEEGDPCGLPPRTGKCKAWVERFYYDTEKQMCKQFTYGGCAGNNNNFRTLEACDQRCGMNKNIGIHGMPGSRGQGWRINSPGSPTGANRESSQDANNIHPPSTGLTARCKLPKAPGSCYSSIRSFYYDVETKSCKLFFYSGCFGNANRFITREDCENLCKKPLDSEGGSSTNEETTNPPNKPKVHELGASTESSSDSRSHEKDFCKEDPAPGNCNEKQLRFYYDSVAGQCLPFVFSGCSGNRNNFATESNCMSSCGNKPTLEQLADEMVLSCTFGNKTVPLGGTVGKNQDNDYSGEEPACGIPICECVTPPAVTCVERMCPEPTTTTERPSRLCPVPSCLRHCTLGTGPNGCPTCDCGDDKDKNDQTETVVKQAPVKSSVKG